MSTLATRRTTYGAGYVVLAAVTVMFFAPAKALNGQDNPTCRVTLRVMRQQAPAPGILAAAAYDSKRHRMLVFGGRVPGDRDPSATLVSLDLSTERWATMNVEGANPKGTFGPAMVYVQDEDALYLFGGWPENADQPLAELWSLPFASEAETKWRLISDGSDGPAARNGCCMVADTTRKRLLVHGGDAGPHPKFGFRPLDDLWEFDLAKKKWRLLQPSGSPPKPRWNHAATISHERGVMFVFGGAGYVVDHEPVLVRDQAIFALDLETLHWRQLPARGDPPPPVEGTSLTYDKQLAVLLVAGGLSLADSGDPGSRSVWCFDLENHTWGQRENLLPTTRRDHVTVYDPVRSQHVLVGGHIAEVRGNFYVKSPPLADVLAISITTEQAK